MAFIPYAYPTDGPVPWVWLPAGDATWTVGQAAVIISGKCEPVSSGSGQDTDEGAHYIAMFEETIAAADDGAVRPFLRAATPGLVFETYLQAQDTDIANNKRYTLHTDGKCITGTTTKGVFQPIDWDSTDANAKCRGIFIDTVDDLGAS